MITETTLIRFPVVSLRRIENPFERQEDKVGKNIYISVVDIKSIPDQLVDWRKINPRDPNKNSNVSKSIAKTLDESPELFLFKNRGITILAERVSLDNAKSVVEVEFSNESLHGLLDGGHTYEVIRSFLTDLSMEDKDELKAYVKIEFLTGFESVVDAVSIVEARNTSTQVKDQSLEELKGNYEMIKKVIANNSYAHRVAYKENEFNEEGSKKDLDVKEILSYLLCFDTGRFGNENHPLKSYSSKQAVVDEVRDRKEEIKKYTVLLPDILKLRDIIYRDLPDAYNKAKKISEEKVGRFGSLVGVKHTGDKPQMKETELVFIDEKSDYRIPDAFIYPVLGAFRYLVDSAADEVKWKTDPFKFFEVIKFEIARRIGERAMDIKNPTKMGKDVSTWQTCYDSVRLAYLEQTK
ncbi:MAG: hypothetical protein RLY57_330 [Candidatus Parcubacteria bacterium]|jgi:hypothetical protein